MGRVYLGLSPAGRAVAIKVVHPDLASDADFLRRFGQEVAAARAVSGIYTAPVVAEYQRPALQLPRSASRDDRNRDDRNRDDRAREERTVPAVNGDVTFAK